MALCTKQQNILAIV